jgi:TolB protein
MTTESGTGRGRIAFAAVCACFVWALSCVAVDAVDIVVAKPGAVNAKSAVDISAFDAGGSGEGRLFVQTLETDLVRSGWFVVTNGGVVAVGGRWISLGGARAELLVRNAITGAGYLSREFEPKRGDVPSAAHAAADAIVEALCKVPGIASTRITMIGKVRGRPNLYVCDADARNLIRITNQDSPCLAPNWSPDGERLLYTSFHCGYPDLYLIDLASGRRMPVSRQSGLNMAGDVSPDGRRIAMTLSKDGNPEIYVLLQGVGRLTRITDTPRAAEASPSWSPDGSRLVFVSDRSGRPQLYIASSVCGEAKRITFRGEENVAPDWGSDGRIAYCSRREGRYRIIVDDPATGKSEEVATDDTNYEDPSWAPDRRHIVVVRSQRFRSQLWILDTMGDKPRLLTSQEGDWYSPAWSPR